MPSPDLLRKPSKFNCSGLDLVHPPDLIPENYYPYLVNVRSIVAGTVEVRPGFTEIVDAGAPVHTIRRLNNLVPDAITATQIFLGAGSSFKATLPTLATLVTGLSGNPLTSVIFRPDQSPEPWMYVADRNRNFKVNTEQTVRNIGIAPPTVPPVPEITTIGGVDGVTNNGIIQDGDDNTGWAGTGTAGSVAVSGRVPASTIVSVAIYDTGANGWCTMSPENSAGSYEFLQPLCRLIITGSGGPETVTVEDVTSDILPTTISGIIYDSGSTGLCSIALSTQTPHLQRNSLLKIGPTVITRVLSVTTGPDGLSSFRCFTPSTHTAGTAVVSIVSFRCYTTISIPTTDYEPDTSTSITAGVLETSVTTGTGFATKTQAQDITVFAFTNGQNRPLTVDDYLHISLRFDVPTNVTSGRILFDVDPTVNDFTQNYYYKTFTQADLASITPGSLFSITAGNAQWTELFWKFADMVRVGSNQSVNLSAVQAIRVELTVTGTTIMDFAGIYVTGSYGPDVQTGSPVGITYQYRYRDSRTGAKSIPSPQNRYELFPLRQQVKVLVTASTDPQVDTIDIQRFDPSLAALVYVGSTANVTGLFTDDTQSSLIAGNPSFETNVLQPWPTLDTPKSGVINVAGTSVTWVSGDKFDPNLLPETVILIGEDAVLTYGQPSANGEFVELQSNLGAHTNIGYKIASPTLLGQPLPVMFGPLEGPTATYAFAINDPRNPGNLYWTNGNDLDSASDQNFVEVTSPSEPLIAGVVWQTLIYLASARRVFLGTPSFNTSSTGSPTITFTFTELTTISGAFSPWAMCKGPQGVYMVGWDGIYFLNYNSASYYSQQIYPLFPHDGKQPVDPVRGFYPVDMLSYNYLRLSYADLSLYFDYRDIQGHYRTMRIDSNGGFWPHLYAG